jgi:hypothetical protein
MPETGGFDEALVRAVLFVMSDDLVFDQRSALAMNILRQQSMHLSLAAFKTLVRQQAFVLHQNPGKAAMALASMVPQTDKRKALLRQAEAIVSGSGAITAADAHQIALLSRVLLITDEKAAKTGETSDNE